MKTPVYALYKDADLAEGFRLQIVKATFLNT